MVLFNFERKPLQNAMINDGRHITYKHINIFKVMKTAFQTGRVTSRVACTVHGTK